MAIENKFYSDIEEIIVHWEKFNPTKCHFLGIHDYDGILPNYSCEAIADRIIEIKEDIVHLIALKRDYSDPYTMFEFHLVKLSLEQELYELDVYKEYTFNPIFYIKPLLVLDHSVSIRSFAPLEKRIEIVAEYLSNIPDFLSYPKEHLVESIPSIHLDLALESFIGLGNFLKSDLKSFIHQSTNPDLVKKSDDLLEKASKSITNFISLLNNTYKPKSSKNFSLGKANFLLMLRKEEFVNIDAETLDSVSEADLNRNFTLLQSILSKKDSKYLEEIQKDILHFDELILSTNSVLERIVEFIENNNIVDIPSDEACKLTITPESIRKYSIGALNPPGPFENSDLETYFYITPPDPNWNDIQKQNYYKFFNKSTIDTILMNEIYPGQFLKFLFEKYRTKSIISKLFSRAISMIEGYPNYVVEMMIEEGYANACNEPDKIKIGQLLISLLRNVRFLVSIRLHCFDMSMEDGIKMFKEKAFLSDESAEREVKMLIINPMIINYTLGSLLIKKLREDYKNEKGDLFSLKDFHNELLSYGSAPITLLRQVMLNDPKIIPEVLPNLN